MTDKPDLPTFYYNPDLEPDVLPAGVTRAYFIDGTLEVGAEVQLSDAVILADGEGDVTVEVDPESTRTCRVVELE